MKTQPAIRPQQVHEDHYCAICLEVLYMPVRLPKCRHIFCQTCLKETVNISNNQSCPLCRNPFSQGEVRVFEQFWRALMSRYPQAIAAKKQHIQESVLFRMVVGNSTIVLQDREVNRYQWTFFIKPVKGQTLSEHIQKVQVKLDSSFHNAKVSCRPKGCDNVVVSRIGWGPINIRYTIFWKPGSTPEVTKMSHLLKLNYDNEEVVTVALTRKLKH